MKRTTKLLSTLAISFTAALLVASPSMAAEARSDSALLSDCSNSISAQFETADSIKAANITSRRGIFKAKFRVSAEGERSTVLCTIKEDQIAVLSCVNGAVCASSSIAAK